ncbi:MAG: glycosyltransferase [Nitriliruptorales bacterium]
MADTEVSLSVTVLIPAHNEAATIQQVVRSCRHQTYLVEKVVVIDDGSTDETAGLAREAGAHVVTAPGGSKARALNVGLEEVRTELVVAVDADTFLAPDAINWMVTTVEEGYDATCAAVVPQQSKGLFIRARKFEYVLSRRWLKRAENALGRVTVLSGAAYCFRTTSLRAIGGFPLDVPLAEDMDLTWTLTGAGYRCGYSPRAVAYTLEPETLSAYVGQVRRWGAGVAQTIARHRRQLVTDPRRLFVVGGRIWDLFSGAMLWLVVAWLFVRYGSYGVGALGLMGVAVSVVLYGLTVRDLGFIEAAKCLMAHAVVAPPTRWLYRWAMIREWALGRHYTSWTGRQGSQAVITGMTPRRKLSLGTTSMVMVAGLVALGRPPAGPSPSVPPVLAAEPFPAACPPNMAPPQLRLPARLETSPIPEPGRNGPAPTGRKLVLVAAGPDPVPAPLARAEKQTGSRSTLPPAGEPRRSSGVAPPSEPTPQTGPEPVPTSPVEPEPAPEPTAPPEPPADLDSPGKSGRTPPSERSHGPETGAGGTETA